ncbi:MAG: T9SS type A sorting domain-containing protein [Bacteroidia bacterium]|nr:T9SS type A sorting domain-containing protein [Bacteroidia bacterium]
MKRVLMVVYVCLSCLVVQGQVVDLDWVRSFGGSNGEQSKSVTDANGNVYTVGEFRQTVDFDPGSGKAERTSKGQNDVFLLKIDSAGNFDWVVTYGGTSYDAGAAVALDSMGSIYVIGFFYGTTDLDPGSATTTVTSKGKSDIFVQRFDLFGNLKWAFGLGGAEAEYPGTVTVDHRGHVLITGAYEGSVDFEPGSGTTTLKSVGGTDLFMQKLDTAGKLVWAKSVGGSRDETVILAQPDSQSNVLFAAGYFGSADFDPGSKTKTLTSQGLQDVAVGKLDSKGDLVWVETFGSSGHEMLRGLALDLEGNAYVTGGFRGSVDFDPGSGSLTLSSNGKVDIYVNKFLGNGKHSTAFSIGGKEDDHAYGITVDDKKAIYITGSFESTVDFDPGKGNQTHTSNGSSDFYVEKFDSTGAFKWVVTGGSSGLDQGISLACGPFNSILVNGRFTGKVDFDPSSNVVNLSSNGAYDVFLQKLNQCEDRFKIDTVVTCDSYKWINGITYYKNNYTAKHILKTSQGCDSVITLNLTLNNLGEEKITACDSFTWIDGKTYKKSTTSPQHTLTNSFGCDSLVTLHLDLGYADHVTESISACGSYTWIDGKTYSSSSQAVYTLTNAKGCDSVITLDLFVGQQNTAIDKVQACGNSYTWINGKQYTSNSYGDTVIRVNASGCDSVITLDLTLGVITRGDQVVSACDSFTWTNGITYKSSNYSDKDTLVSSYGCDSILRIQLTLGYSSQSTDEIEACAPITWIDGKIYSQNNNSAVYTLTNTLGCDSVVTLDYTLKTVDVSLTVTDTSLKSDNSNAYSFKWLNCGNNFAQIPNETSNLFIAQESGSYSVEIEEEGCLDTSECVTLTGLSVDNIDQFPLQVFPNPTKGLINIEMSQMLGEKHILVVNAQGQLVYEEATSENRHVVNLNQPSGVYILSVLSENRLHRKELIID